MSPQMALDLSYKAVFLAAQISAPILLTAIIVGVLVNILQAVTSIRDMSLTFVPKVVAAMVVMALTLPWGLSMMTSYFQEMYSMFGSVTP